jgi:hypothetical protein
MDALEIMFEDLNEYAKEKVLKFYGLKSESEGNFEIMALAILEKEELNGRKAC